MELPKNNALTKMATRMAVVAVVVVGWVGCVCVGYILNHVQRIADQRSPLIGDRWSVAINCAVNWRPLVSWSPLIGALSHQPSVLSHNRKPTSSKRQARDGPAECAKRLNKIIKKANMQSVSADPLSGRACGNTPRFLFRNSNLKIQTDSQTDRQTDRQPARQTYRQIGEYSVYNLFRRGVRGEGTRILP